MNSLKFRVGALIVLNGVAVASVGLLVIMLGRGAENPWLTSLAFLGTAATASVALASAIAAIWLILRNYFLVQTRNQDRRHAAEIDRMAAIQAATEQIPSQLPKQSAPPVPVSPDSHEARLVVAQRRILSTVSRHATAHGRILASIDKNLSALLTKGRAEDD